MVDDFSSHNSGKVDRIFWNILLFVELWSLLPVFIAWSMAISGKAIFGKAIYGEAISGKAIYGT